MQVTKQCLIPQPMSVRVYHLDACENVLWCFGTMESPGIFLKCVLASNRPEVSSSRLIVFQHLASYLTSLELH